MSAKSGNEGFRDLPMGGVVVKPGSTASNLTGSWRSEHPVVDLESCVHCLICWELCPDNCLIVADGKLMSADLDYCKGCGICAAECPRKCIEMVPDLPIEESA